ncbi:hypothetical protein [Citreimonas sp.]
MKLITILQAGALCVLAIYGAAAANSSDATAPCPPTQATCARP